MSAARLGHSPKAFVRSVQMSLFGVVAVVEGIDDRPFYSTLIEGITGGHRVRIALANELVGFKLGTGKPGVLAAYRKLKRMKALSSSIGGVNRRIVFWLDKDIDDILRKQARSEHVVYTSYYSAENHIFSAADLTRAIALAADLDVESVASVLGHDQDDWRRRVADAWCEWTCFCVAVHRNALGLPGYREHSSQFHEECPRRPAQTARDALLARARSLVGAAELTAIMHRSRRLVSRSRGRGGWDVTFNGKWYARWLQDVALQASAGRQYRAPDLKTLRATALATMNRENRHVADLVRRLHRSISPAFSHIGGDTLVSEHGV